MKVLHARGLPLDAGALREAEANPRGRVWNYCREEVEAGRRPLLPAVVLAQIWRGGPRQAGLARILKSCKIVGTDEVMAKRIGVLLGVSNTSGVVDAMVVLLAVETCFTVVTSDPDDITKIAGCVDYRVPLLTV